MTPFNESKVTYSTDYFEKYENQHAPWSNDQNYILITKHISIRDFKDLCSWIENNFGPAWLNFKFDETISLATDFKEYLHDNQFDIDELAILYNDHLEPIYNNLITLVDVAHTSDDYLKMRVANDAIFGSDYAEANSAYLRKLMIEEQLTVKLAYLNTTAVGFIEIITSPMQTKKEIYYIFVTPAFRHQAIASQLIAAISQPLFAVVSLDDTPINFYKKIGFTQGKTWTETRKL